MADIQGGAQQVDGDTPHDTVDAGNPLKVGGQAIAHGANPPAVAEGDRTNWYANRAGVPWVIGGHPNVQLREISVENSDGPQTDALAVSVPNGLRAVVTRVSILNSRSNKFIRVGFGNTTLPAESINGVDGILVSQELSSRDSITIGDGSGIIGIGGDGEDIRYTCDRPSGTFIGIILNYYLIES